MHFLNDVRVYQVLVVFDQTYDRVPHPDISLENSIAEVIFLFSVCISVGQICTTFLHFVIMIWC